MTNEMTYLRKQYVGQTTGILEGWAEFCLALPEHGINQ